ncbi:aspartyl-tRNA(Asn)/glutamyl-tRNA(Gln) amidotransferase subunit A [Nonomuraea thailandensis]|uniref:Aspartyl-tRNA(Asn)/glutamyl-tRNA(Gln) amidotransferase subunit A n=1 Tax=Nonomuraea thailandensis TaxID=1188745 RepID=A0A9X2K3B1_9ACTN|nr:amidase [Nonomuraea thailandensis]MCP2358868.1 aspartyl-tRNA(Asn)/glutamyl-tRNA(Gln) amidotransferase subunit A [Nonomuraea thailandensis]
MPIPPGPFAGRTITDLARDLRDGHVTATELAGQALAAAEALGPALNAFVTVDAPGALAAARRADEELAAGADRGPLHGLPVAVKDLIMVAGLPATMGSRHFTAYVPDTDAACVTGLRRAGAVIVGKTTTHEFAYGPTGDRSANGPSRNPRDPARMSGGSSGGSAAAVAAGIVPLAIGTDTGGSVRIPAALCGVAGFKPAFGAIPADGVFPLSRSYDHVGVLAGGAEDCLIAYRRLAADVPGEAGDAGDAGDAGGSVGWIDPIAMYGGDPRVTRAVRAVLEADEEVRLPEGFVQEVRETYVAVQSCETAAVHAERLRRAPELFDPAVLERLRVAAQVPGWRYVRALEARQRLAGVVDVLFGGHDVLAMPTVPIVAPLVDEREFALDGRAVEVRPALLALTSPWNVLGLPALTVPAGLVDGLPVGLQLVCRPGDEPRLFATAARLTPVTVL